MRLGDTPVPIPNTKVKPRAADDTVLETVRESRWLPEPRKITKAVLIQKAAVIIKRPEIEMGGINIYRPVYRRTCLLWEICSSACPVTGAYSSAG